MEKDATVVPPANNDPRDPTGSTKEGRSALPDWIEYGYISTNFTRSVSRAVEYAVNDFSLYQVASGLGRTSDASKYMRRSKYWRNHWNQNMTALNHTGFLGPRDANGFIPQDPMSCGGCYWGDHYYQALPWEYSFNAHHDVNTVVSLMGGPTLFVDRLEKSFTPGLYPGGNGQFGHTIFNPGNEPSFTTPYLYNFVNRPDLAVKRSRFIAKSYYAPTPGGLPGNSDAGAMESWLLWNMIGLYPMTGQTTFLIGSPWLSDLTIVLDNSGGKTKALRITSTGVSETAFHVQSVRVNGKPWNKSWLSWSDVFENGGALDFELGDQPVVWATGPLPPSPASEWSSNAAPGDVLGHLPGVEDDESDDGDYHTVLASLALAGTVSVVLPSLGLGLVMWYMQRRRSRSPDAKSNQVDGGVVEKTAEPKLESDSDSPRESSGDLW
jgi:predicted alpha-1,2-mannosidase